MTVFRCILPSWASEENPSLKKVVEGQFDEEKLLELNSNGYNVYYLPNTPSLYDSTQLVDGSQIDTFNYVFVDMDMKEKFYKSKDEFVAKLLHNNPIVPTKIIDSGNGIHAYWRVTDLDAMGYLRLQRRLMRFYNTDEAVGQIFQLMRYPGFVNTKSTEFKLCEYVHDSNLEYNSETLDKNLPRISVNDEQYCETHYSKTYNKLDIKDVVQEIPLKFAHLIKNNNEVKEIWAGGLDDRSKGDYRLGHIMFANGFTNDEAISVLVNSAKALQRAPVHRVNYAINIVEKIWLYEASGNSDELSSSVKDILNRKNGDMKGTRFPCHTYIDNTEYGFRLGHVIGLVAGSGVGKTAVALNMFQGFVQNNPNYDHLFIPLEQPSEEIADRWKSLCGDNVSLHDKVHVISNYDKDGNFRHLSLEEIKDYVIRFQERTGKKIGCIVIDHIGALKKKGKNGENQDLMDICHSMKAFAVQTNTLLIMQSQAPRAKAGIGDLELDKDAAYGTVYFESYCDYLITMWQPVKRCYQEGAPTITAFKFAKIRHKNQLLDQIVEDVRYKLMFDTKTQRLRDLTQDEEKSFAFWNSKATNKRKVDRKSDILEYESAKWIERTV